MIHKFLFFSSLFLLATFSSFGQKLNVNGGILLSSKITLGNQNQGVKFGVFAFGTANYKGVAAESGISFSISQLLKRHTLKTKGKSYGYEVFGLIGSGNNSNLIGSSVATTNTTFLYDFKETSTFKGLGFGFEKEILPGNLKIYNNRRGKFLVRYAKNNFNLHLAFLNDFKAGKIMYGEGTDYGETGTLLVGFSKAQNFSELYQVGFGLSLFTPQANYGKLPRNKRNSEEGRKNVWFTNTDYPETFYANAYAFGTYQTDFYSLHTKLGSNSQKMGAYIQNKLHDGFGLNPRYPWHTDKKDKLYIEIQADLFYKTTHNE
ncbi:hypothetical protein [Flavicella sediminum]|uniref:hypothetical protein n=1 Tax=Flavicella sediminum TaxID=2585141 RepID=UPI0011203613|nr:hypothetical protein [Flavicella sediminum]